VLPVIGSAIQKALAPNSICQQVMTSSTNRYSILKALMPFSLVRDMMHLKVFGAWPSTNLSNTKQLTELTFIVVTLPYLILPFTHFSLSLTPFLLGSICPQGNTESPYDN